MSVKVETLEKNMAKLTIEVDAAEVAKAITAAYNRQKGQISVAGFRKGKVPQAMIEKMYGPEVFFDEAANKMISDSYPKAFDESGLDIVSQPQIDIVTLKKGENFVYTATVATKPEVELGAYKGIEVTKADATVSAQDVEDDINATLSRNARTVTKDGAIAANDIANIDFEGSIDGVPFEGGKGTSYDLTIGSHSFIDNFEDQLIGKKAGDDVDVNVTFPENYQAEDLAGKPALFKCHINEVKCKELPLLDDEFVQDTTEFENVAEYKKDVENKLKKQKEEAAKRAMQDEAVDALIESSKMDIPDPMLEMQVNNMINDFARNMQQQGLSLEQYFQFTGSTMDAFKEQVRPDALKRIQSSLVLEAVAKAEKIEATDADVEERLKEMASMYGLEVEKIRELMQENELKGMKEDIAISKALDFILASAKEKK